jgi:DNA polymerase-3 subunit gamma/tau
MAYQVLARKWRPQDFESVVGQGAVVRALRNALADGRIAHSYLFSGIRGVGKTTVARVLAKALNCQTGPPTDPCNECDICRDITAGSDLDVLEIDAATYSKVEQVRELTDSLRYGPVRNEYKVVIIDEIHRLSRQAFDALLKIVEEPPPYLVFIFATTESEAVPATILSRCQAYQFRRVPLAEMVEHLRRVSAAEELEVSEHGLHLIARASEGSVRDAIALLDQLATFGGGRILDDEVGRILGGVDLALFLDLIRAIVAGEREPVAEFVRTVEDLGWDPRHVYGEFLSYCRDALHLSLDPGSARVDLPAEEAQSLAATATETGYENLLRILNLLLESEMTVRRSESAGLALEIALLRAAELPKLTAIEAVLSGTGGGSAAKGHGGARAAGAAPSQRQGRRESQSRGDRRGEGEPRSQRRDATRSTAPSPQAPTPEPPAPEPFAPEPPDLSDPPDMPEPPGAWEPTQVPVPPAAGSSGSKAAASSADRARPAGRRRAEPEDTGGATAALAPPRIVEGREAVERLLERLRYLKEPLAAHLSGAQSLAVTDGVLVVSTAPGDTVLERTLQRSSNRELLERTLVEMLGPGARWKVRAGDAAAEHAAGSEQDAEEDGVRNDPTVQTVLDLFGGRIEAIERHAESGDNRGACE